MDLGRFHLRPDAQGRHRGVVALAVLVDAYHDPLSGLQLALELEGRVRDLTLEEAVLDAGQHPALLLDPVEVAAGASLHLVGQALHEVGPAERIDGVGDPGLVGKDLLGAKRDLGSPFGGQRQHLVHGVGVQGVGAAQDRRHGLDRSPADVVLDLLPGE